MDSGNVTCEFPRKWAVMSGIRESPRFGTTAGRPFRRGPQGQQVLSLDPVPRLLTVADMDAFLKDSSPQLGDSIKVR